MLRPYRAAGAKDPQKKRILAGGRGRGERGRGGGLGPGKKKRRYLEKGR